MIIAIDTETTGLYLRRGCRAFMVTAVDESGSMFKWIFEVDPFTRKVVYDNLKVKNLYKTLNNYDEWVFHNAPFDLTALTYISPKFNEKLFLKKSIHDTMIAAHCYDSTSHLNLKGLALLHLNYPESDEADLHRIVQSSRNVAKKLQWATAEPTHPTLTPLKKDKKNCDYWIPRELVLRHPDLIDDKHHQEYLTVCETYALGDVERTLGLFFFFQELLGRRGDWEHYIKHSKVILASWTTQNQGFTLKRSKVESTIDSFHCETEVIRKKLIALTGKPDFNPNSGPQVKRYLYDTHKLSVPKFTASDEPSTDSEALEALSEYPSLPLKVRKFIDLKLTYSKYVTSERYVRSYERFQIDGKLYPSLKIAGTKTLRWSCSDPNTQNISKKTYEDNEHSERLVFNLRSIFGPPKGHIWVCIDYTQLQLRIFAQASKDPTLIKKFELGEDIHNAVACEVFDTQTPTSLQRRAAKAINFGIIFGAGQSKIERMSGIPGSYKRFKSRFPLVDSYIKLKEREARNKGFVRTLGGYPLRVERKRAYKACNIIVQGTEGEMVKAALTECHLACRRLPLIPIMVIHDEIIFETKEPVKLSETRKTLDPAIIQLENIMNDAALSVGVTTTTDVNITNTTWAKAKGYLPHVH